MKNKQITIARRDSGEKSTAPNISVEASIAKTLEQIQQALFDKAKKSMSELTGPASDMETFKHIIGKKGGFIKAYLCDDVNCEDAIKQQTGATVRLVPFKVEGQGKCVYCASRNGKTVYFARSY